MHHNLLRNSTHTTLQPQDNFGYRPRTGRVLTTSDLQAKNKKKPNKWMRPPSQRGKVERRIEWKKKIVIVTEKKVPSFLKMCASPSYYSGNR